MMIAAFTLFAATLAGVACGRGSNGIIVAAGTTLVDSGYLDAWIHAFEAQTGTQVKLIGVTSAEAFRLGGNGSADVLITFDPEGETTFVRSGRSVASYPFMANNFVIAGPPDDPARIRGLGALEAARRLVRYPFVSRDDGSGTHKRELALWQAANVRPRQLIGAGASAGATLSIADERGAYTLTDRITLAAFQSTVRLTTLVDGDPSATGDTLLAARYTVILVKPRDGGATSLARQSTANAFVGFLLAKSGMRAAT